MSLLSPALLLVESYQRTNPDTASLGIARTTQAFIEAHPDCLLRTCLPGHLTSSAWIVNRQRSQVLLTHHRKLEKWLQLGGHADGDPDLAAVALKEATEESGLTQLRLVSSELFDLDAHVIPARRETPAHMHYDFRFLIEGDSQATFAVSNESLDLAWVELGQVASLNSEESLLRMVRKTLLGRGA